MGTRVTLLAHIGYVPSYVPKTPKPIPKLLEDDEGWQKLIASVNDYIEGCKAKNKNKGVVKPFTIRIVDTSSSGAGEKEPGAKKVHEIEFFFWFEVLTSVSSRRRKGPTLPLPHSPPNFRSMCSLRSLRRSASVKHAKSRVGYWTMETTTFLQWLTLLRGQSCWYVALVDTVFTLLMYMMNTRHVIRRRGTFRQRS